MQVEDLFNILVIFAIVDSCVLYCRLYSLLQTIRYPRPRTALSAISEAELPVESPSTFTARSNIA